MSIKVKEVKKKAGIIFGNFIPCTLAFLVSWLAKGVSFSIRLNLSWLKVKHL